MKLTLKVWRQKNSNSEGKLVAYDLDGISPDSSFLEMLDILNETLIERGEEPVAFDHDCREGICGMCSLVINGIPHGHEKQTTVCQLHMRHFKDGQTVTIEPWRSKPLPVIKDLIVDRTALEKIQQAGGFVSISTGGVPDANATPIAKQVADVAMDAAACIGCGACVAACKNASAMLFMSAKVSSSTACHRARLKRIVAFWLWSKLTTNWASVTVPIWVSVRLYALKALLWIILPSSTATTPLLLSRTSSAASSKLQTHSISKDHPFGWSFFVVMADSQTLLC